MKHYVFSAGTGIPENQLAISAANTVAKLLDTKFGLENDSVEAPYHSSITVEGNSRTPNIEVYLENEDVQQLIKDCMEWAVELHIQEEFLKSLKEKGNR